MSRSEAHRLRRAPTRERRSPDSIPTTRPATLSSAAPPGEDVARILHDLAWTVRNARGDGIPAEDLPALLFACGFRRGEIDWFLPALLEDCGHVR